jgi:hypothetical protein
MSKVLPLVRQVQAEAVDPNVPVSKLLRLAKVIATKLDQKEALKWINGELDGYMDGLTKDVPDYRRIGGQPKVRNPYHGWQTIQFEHPEVAQNYSTVPLGQSIGSLEKELERSDDRGGALIFAYPTEMANMMRKAMGSRLEVAVFLSQGSVWGVVEAVRDLVLNWSLELEKAGVLGEEMTFTAEEKREAGPVTQQYFIQNVGVLGDVSDNAKVENTQAASVPLDINAVARFVDQALANVGQLPKELRRNLGPVLAELRQEVGKAMPEQSRLRALLASTRTIAEGAVGNLTASGIITMITKILGVG